MLREIAQLSTSRDGDCIASFHFDMFGVDCMNDAAFEHVEDLLTVGMPMPRIMATRFDHAFEADG